MIILKTLKWSNVFSYGEDNILDLSANQITQLLGKNGHGKSSIGLILEEVFYNKNSKGIKKADIINRYVSAKSYSIEVEFSKDADTYQIKNTRGSTQSVKLYKNGEDISSHTSTNTFKQIEEILGFDHKTFSQLIYQSSANSLEFLTATDTTRKKFLIDLLNLNKYVEAFEIFKQASKQVSEQVLEIETKIKTTEAWVTKHKTISLDEKPIQEVPKSPQAEMEEVGELTGKVKSVEQLNKQIIQNNQYKKLLAAIPVEELTKQVEKPESTTKLILERGEVAGKAKQAEQFISKVKNLSGLCPTCLQDIDTHKIKSMVDEHTEIISQAELKIKELDSNIKLLEARKQEFDKVSKYKNDWESYHSLINPELQEDLLDKEDIDQRIKELQAKILEAKANIEQIEANNNIAINHNSKVAVIKEQMQDMLNDLEIYKANLKDVTAKYNILQLLQKTFSTNGLIAYKIECLVKDLEELTNRYLGDLSAGRFQISFQVVSDKLNVVITDNGKDIDILALSSGEKARVNTATLLAIRKLMQSLSNIRINLLILDETIENLDTEGKEKLIEVLLEEEHLNTIIISHGFSHPLLEKITVVKTNNISRIET